MEQDVGAALDLLALFHALWQLMQLSTIVSWSKLAGIQAVVAMPENTPMPILGREAKVAALAEITARLGIAEADVMAVGDGANDLGMLKRAGAGVALHAKPVVAAEVERRINHGDLSALLFLQGYRRDEFRTRSEERFSRNAETGV